MTAQQVATQVVSLTAKTPVKGKRAIDWRGLQAGANSRIMGVADTNAEIDESFLCIQGISAIVESGAAIPGVETAADANGVRLMTDADGRFIPWTAGSNVAAQLVPGQLATGAGQYVEVFPITV
jgi:hypothetical protein